MQTVLLCPRRGAHAQTAAVEPRPALQRKHTRSAAGREASWGLHAGCSLQTQLTASSEVIKTHPGHKSPATLLPGWQEADLGCPT